MRRGTVLLADSHSPMLEGGGRVILMDDLGPGTASTYGGDINTPTLDRGAKMGVSFNRFHSTAMCLPTRAALLTGRNHTRVGNGQIAAITKAKGWIPQTAQLTPRPVSMASWDSIPEGEKPFQRRLMEVFAGFTEHADYNAGRDQAPFKFNGTIGSKIAYPKK